MLYIFKYIKEILSIETDKTNTPFSVCVRGRACVFCVLVCVLALYLPPSLPLSVYLFM